MSRKKRNPGGNRNPKLSPQNYIRQKVRNLPIEVCYITPDWDVKGMAKIVVVRTHKNGNKTLGIFLIDLFCLGIKDTFYSFNIPASTVENYFLQDMELEKIDYDTVHNIIYGAADYASGLGIEPYADWKLTQYILEANNGAIPKILIEFGKNGKPCFMSGPHDDSNRINKILNILDRNVGTGNYNFMIPTSEYDEF